MAEKKLRYKEVPQALGFVLRTIWAISPTYVILIFTRQLKDRLVPYATLFIAAAITTKLPELASDKGTIRDIVMLSLLAFAIELSAKLFDIVFTKTVVRTEAKVGVVMREHFYERFARLPYHLYEDKDVIDAFNYADEFMHRFSRFGLYTIARSVGAVIEFFVATIALLAVAWYMPLLLLIFVPFLVRSVFKLNRDSARTSFWKLPAQRRIWTIERLFQPRQIKEARLYGVIEHFLGVRRTLTEEVNEAEQKIQFRREKLNLIQDAEINAASLVASIIAIWRIAYHGAPLGTFLLAQQLTSRAGAAIDMLFSDLSTFDEDLYGFSEFRYITEELQPKADKDLTVVDERPSVELKKLGFTYPESEHPALRQVNLSIPYGSSLAIVGENGAGKTTLTKLILGLYRPESGVVLVSGQDLQDRDAASWLKRVGVLLQDFGMNEDMTIREAVWTGDITKPLDDTLIWQALDEAELSKAIRKLPHGLDTYLGKWIDEDKGTELSGGQLQRLAIARTLFRNPDVLILDEPTSAIDANAEERIFSRLQKAREGKTTIFISHRFSTVRRAERIIFMEEGKIIEQGTHEELMKNRGKYYDMFTLQAAGYQ